jgi:hypothetical protein
MSTASSTRNVITARQFGQRVAGHRPQRLQRNGPFFRALHQLFCDKLPAFMVPTVWQTSKDFLKYYVHIRDCPFIDLFHFYDRTVIDATLSA